MAPQVESPFSSAPERRWVFGVDWMLLVTLVAAATATLVGYAFFLPSVTNEINAWLGRSAAPGEDAENRRTQVVFLLLCYSAPMILGLVARLMQLLGRKAASKLVPEEDDDARFRME